MFMLMLASLVGIRLKCWQVVQLKDAKPRNFMDEKVTRINLHHAGWRAYHHWRTALRHPHRGMVNLDWLKSLWFGGCRIFFPSSMMEWFYTKWPFYVKSSLQVTSSRVLKMRNDLAQKKRIVITPRFSYFFLRCFEIVFLRETKKT